MLMTLYIIFALKLYSLLFFISSSFYQIASEKVYIASPLHFPRRSDFGEKKFSRLCMRPNSLTVERGKISSLGHFCFLVFLLFGATVLSRFDVGS